MAKKEKVIEVMCCDKCIAENVQVWPCARCEKDVCRNCCYIYAVARIHPPLPVSAGLEAAISPWDVAFNSPMFKAMFCDDCGKSEVSTALLRAGFQETAKRVAKK